MKLITFNGAADYSKLNHLPFNRNFSVRQDLIDKMNLYSFNSPLHLIETDLIDGKLKKWLIDGQHRAITAAFLDITFTAILVDVKFKSINEIVHYVASLNSAQKPWSIISYVEAFNFLGYKEYNTLLSVKNSSPYTIETIACILAGYRTSGQTSKTIKNGTFVVNHLDHAKYALSLAAKLGKYQKLTSRMLLALNYVCSLKTFDEKKFTSNYKTNAKQIKELKLDDYSDIFSSWL